MKRPLLALTLIACTACALAEPAPPGVHGRAELARQWTVFAPLVLQQPMVFEDVIKTVPDKLTVAGRAIAPQSVQPAEGGRLDFRKLHKAFPQGTEALVFIPVDVKQDGWTTFGLAADWWLHAWIDGKPLLDTTAQGNEAWPPSISNHLATVKLTAGKHLLAVRFIAGRGSAVLAVGGPAELRKLGPSQWKPVKQVAAEREGPECVPGGRFEDGLEGTLPHGWTTGMPDHAFKPGELSLIEDGALEGKRSLRIRTAGDGLRMMSVPVKLDPRRLHIVRFKARFNRGNYLSIAVQDDAATGNTGFLQAVGHELHLVKKSKMEGDVEIYQGYYYFDRPNMHMVLRAHGEVDVIIDNLSIRPLSGHSRRYHSHSEQRRPWDATWFDRHLSGDVVTPHTSWATPLAGGPVKLLGLMPRWHGRILVELGQRMSIEHEMIPFKKSNDWENDWWTRRADGQPELVRTRERALEQLNRPVDCVLMWELSASTPGPEATRQLLKKVADGAGLVITGFDQPYYPYPDADKTKPRGTWEQTSREAYYRAPWSRAINDANRTQPNLLLPGQVGKTTVEYFEYGKGRIVLVQQIDPAWFLVPDGRDAFETRAEALLKLIRWASRRTAKTTIAGVATKADAKPSSTVRFKLEDRPDHLDVVLSGPTRADTTLRWWTAWDHETDPLARGSLALDTGATRVAWPLPKTLPGGHVSLCLQLVRAGKVLDHASVDIATMVPAAVQGIGLAGPGAFVPGGSPIDAVVKLNAPLGDNQTLELRLEDAHGRLWQRRTITNGGPRIDASFEPVPARTLVHRIVATLHQGEHVLSRRTRELCITRGQRWKTTHFDYQVWQLPVGTYHFDYLGALASAQFRRHGITSSIHVDAHRNIALSDIRSLPYLGMNFPSRNNKVIGDPEHAPRMKHCLTSGGEHGRLRKRIVDRQIRVEPNRGVRWAPLAWLLGHEMNIKGFGGRMGGDPCFSPSCLRDLREMMKREAGDLDTLNRWWGTLFKTWEEVTPIVLDDAVTAGTDGAMARWIDHRRHMDRVFLNFQSTKRQLVDRYTPGIVAVHDNFLSADSFSGVDYWLQVNKLVAGSGFDSTLLRSFTPPERRHLMLSRSKGWGPSIITEDAELFAVRYGHAPWTSLLQGMHGFGYWAGIFLMDPNSNMIQPLQPDLRTTDFARWSNAPVKRIRLGLHRLSYAGRFDDSGIAILYSRASEHAATAWRGRHFRNPLARSLWPETEAGSISSLLHQGGYQYSRISDEQIRGGLLEKNNVKLLVLPVAQAVSPEAAEAIRRFVTTGGTVLADVRPAVVTEHGVRHGAGGALDDVFGIEQDTAWSAFNLMTTSLEVKLGDGDAVKAPAAVTGSGLKLAGARALVQSDVPVMLVNRVGRGRAVLLNALVSRLGGAARPVLDDVLARAGIDPLFGVTRPDGDDGAPAVDDPDDGMFGNAEGFMDALAGAGTRPVLYRHVLGGADLVGLSSNRQRHGAGTTTLKVTWPRPGHVYDVVNNRYLGRQTAGTISKPAEGVAVFVVVPHRIEKPTVQVRQRPDRLGRPILVVDVTAKTDGSWQRALQVKLDAPKDSKAEPIVDTVLCTDGAARFDALLPLDAPRGTWTATVTDAVSAEAVTTRFELE